MRIGILSLQGCVDPHQLHLNALGVHMVAIRYPEDCMDIDGYIIPGGESTTMLKLLQVHNLDKLLAKEWLQKPVWGICAGAILLAKTVTSPAQLSYGVLDYSIIRNAYGSQVMSHYGEVAGYKVAFIRAPKIESYGSDVKVLAVHPSTNSPIWVANGKSMATTFHPELNYQTPSPMHKFFISLVNNVKL